MKNNKILAWLLVVCLMMSGLSSVLAEGTASLSDFEALQPIMNLIAGAVVTASDEPQPIPGAEGTLSNTFVDAFFRLGTTADASLGMTADMLGDTAKQEEYLGRIFAAKVPTLQPIAQAEPSTGTIGFYPMTVNTATEAGGIQIIGELYLAEKPIKELSEAEYLDVVWLERAIYTFQSDPSAQNGFRLTGFSTGTEFDVELAMQGYFEEILVEYVNTALGFSVQYPSVFTDDLLVEDTNGVSAKLPDGKVSFFAKRVQNASKASLESHVSVIANGISGSSFQINEEFRYATVTYTTADGNTVFDVYIVTDKYIYQAELSFPTQLSNQYSMFTTYLENTFMVDEVSVG